MQEELEKKTKKLQKEIVRSRPRKDPALPKGKTNGAPRVHIYIYIYIYIYTSMQAPQGSPKATKGNPKQPTTGTPRNLWNPKDKRQPFSLTLIERKKSWRWLMMHSVATAYLNLTPRYHPKPEPPSLTPSWPINSFKAPQWHARCITLGLRGNQAAKKMHASLKA